MADDYFKKIATAGIFVVLLFLSYLVLKPILTSVIFGVILAFLLTPVYKFLLKYFKYRDLTVAVICVLLILILVLPLWFLTPIAIDQSFKFYLSVQNIDFVTPLKSIVPSLFASETFSKEIGNILTSFVSKSANSLLNSLTGIILNFPKLALQFAVVLFTFYFTLRDSDILLGYVRSLLPFSKSVQDRFFESSSGITMSVLYGQVVVGIIQGLIMGLGFFIFKVPNALLLTLFSVLAGLFPVIGTYIVWIPIMVYLFIAGQNTPAIGVLIFGLISANIDTIIRPFIVAKRTKVHTSVVFVGMIGGLFFFGILGLILGPLILAYLLVFLDLYRSKGVRGFLIEDGE